MRLVALTGPAGSGKSHCARLLELKHGFEALAFADPLYEAIGAITGLAPESLARQKEAPIPWLGASPRMLLQTLGTEWGRQMVHVDLWVRIAERRLAIAREQGVDRVVFQDCRFANEAAWVRSCGGEVWALWGRGLDVRPHASEAGLALHLIDRRLFNGPGADLEGQVEAAMARAFAI
jgi:hypothetical protein